MSKSTLAWGLMFTAKNWQPGRIIGIFFFLDADRKPWNDGMRTALFSSRREARLAAVNLRARGTEVTPVRVRVSLGWPAPA